MNNEKRTTAPTREKWPPPVAPVQVRTMARAGRKTRYRQDRIATRWRVLLLGLLLVLCGILAATACRRATWLLLVPTVLVVGIVAWQAVNESYRLFLLWHLYPGRHALPTMERYLTRLALLDRRRNRREQQLSALLALPPSPSLLPRVKGATLGGCLTILVVCTIGYRPPQALTTEPDLERCVARYRPHPILSVPEREATVAMATPQPEKSTAAPSHPATPAAMPEKAEPATAVADTTTEPPLLFEPQEPQALLCDAAVPETAPAEWAQCDEIVCNVCCDSVAVINRIKDLINYV